METAPVTTTSEMLKRYYSDDENEPGALKRYYSDDENKPDASESENENESGADTVTTDAGYAEASEGRDEVKEIEKDAMRDRIRVRQWRLGAFIALCLTAFAVTFASYRLLEDTEKKNFETAFEQFSRTVADAAISRQVDMRDSLMTFVILLSNHAKETNQKWPFVTLRRFEDYGSNFIKQSHAEVMATFPKVTEEDREAFLNYTYENSEAWVEESHIIQKGSLERLTGSFFETYNPYITQATPQGLVKDVERSVYWPNWQYSPPPASYGWVNLNIATVPDYANIIEAVEKLKNETLSTRVRKYTSIPMTMSYEEHDLLHSKFAESSLDYPHSFLWRAVHEDSGDFNSKIVGMVGAGFAWDDSLLNLLPEGVSGIHVHITNGDCNQSYTYTIRGPHAIYLPEDEYHEGESSHKQEDNHHEHQRTDRYRRMGVRVSLSPHSHPDYSTTPGHCLYEMTIYPSSEFESAYHTDMPKAFATVVAITFGVIAVFFFGYDVVVQRMNRSLIQRAARSNEILSALIPEHLRDRIVAEKHNDKNKTKSVKKEFKIDINGEKDLDCLLDDDNPSRPMADLYLETTVLYADISGFTAWSSIREPIHVFTLLENIFQAFDLVAKKRRIFKVETVGDCYIAVTGLPEPRADHAVSMVRFARDIISRMRTLAKQLEVSLGPDTGDLALRVGIHSGPVTGGVLRGDRTRFQLFGDTMNTASSMESVGRANRIHCSKETAELIKKAGKGDWLIPRTDAVNCKGIGSVETYWISTNRERGGSVHSGASGGSSNPEATPAPVHGPRMAGLDEKTHRLIEWNVEMLLRLIKQIVAHREACCKRPLSIAGTSWPSDASFEIGEMPLDEVREIISLPEPDEKAAKRQRNPDSVEVPEEVIAQLHLYVSTIATMYNKNPFHNFSHASHVVMSVVKLMSRIVAPSRQDAMKDTHNAAGSLHDHTYGITSDPLTQFACAYSGLIHDVDHQGVSNAQLVKEGLPVAKKYHDRTVAEQNSFDLSWDLLMTPAYETLRRYLFPEKSELVRFRQLVVNSIMSTDIADKELKNLRNDRWDKAFSNGSSSGHEDENKRDEVNRKATIVIEHIIQASDVSHTMQHWHVYRKWNQNLFEELYVAYLAGRMDSDPTTFWYKGEFGFFDFYIIPLTRKLKDCGVFGVSSDEYLQYALANRAEWEARGEAMVKEMSAECRKKYGEKLNILDMVQEESVVFV